MLLSVFIAALAIGCGLAQDRATEIADRVWAVLDFDGDGQVTLQDFKDLVMISDINGDGRISYEDEFRDGWMFMSTMCEPEARWTFNQWAAWTDDQYPTTNREFIEEGNIEAIYRSVDTGNVGHINRRQFMTNMVAFINLMGEQGVRCPNGTLAE